jgi:hypothetical protein
MVIAGCAGRISPVQRLPSDEATWAPSLGGYEVSAGDERAVLEDLVSETRRIVVTPSFRSHVVQYTGDRVLKASTTGKSVDGRTALAHYLGVAPDGGKPDFVIISNDGKDDPKVPGETGPSQVVGQSRMHLSPEVVRRWQSSNLRRKSCAINTVAHELTHTVIDRTSGHAELLFRDGGYTWMWLLGGQHLVSYTFGTIAQCTWLQEKNGEDFDRCVERMGTKNFTGDGCSPE